MRQHAFVLHMSSFTNSSYIKINVVDINLNNYKKNINRSNRGNNIMASSDNVNIVANANGKNGKLNDNVNNVICNGMDGELVGPMLRNSIHVLSPHSRRPQTDLQALSTSDSAKSFQYLTLTVRKDENGYGMKVSGDNPVFVESVKPGGAAQVAGLIAGDMILRVNGTEVRSEEHPTVVSLIKASTIVELAVKRSQKYVRPTSVGVVPLTPVLSGRDRASITGPQPVDSIKRREMETYKIQTLQKMLEQEKLNLERLKSDKNNRSYKLSENNIHKLREQLRQIGVEDTSTNNNKQNKTHQHNASFDSTTASPSPSQHLALNFISSRTPAALSGTHLQHMLQLNNQNNGSNTPVSPPQPTNQSSPAFLSLLPRSLSSLSLGGRKNKIDRELITSPFSNTTNFLHITSTSGKMVTVSTLPNSNDIMLQSLHSTPTSAKGHRNSPNRLNHLQQQEKDQSMPVNASKQPMGKIKNKLLNQEKHSFQEDVPPPLPQRNPHRHNSQTDILSYSNSNNSIAINGRNVSPISDLDHTNSTNQQSDESARNSSQAHHPNGNMSKRSKAKIKALSDPKISSNTSSDHKNKQQFIGNTCTPPPLPPRQQNIIEDSQKTPGSNSIDTLMQYPLIATCTPVHRDNLSAAFPLSQRPNIVQQLQQHQYQQQQFMQNVNGMVGAAHNGAVGVSSSHNLNHQKHRRIVSAPDNIHERQLKTNSGSWELLEKDDEITPPGTPPPPYRHDNSVSTLGNEDASMENNTLVDMYSPNNHWMMSPSTHSSSIQMPQINTTQKEIISMEDEDSSDHEGPFIDENGPFNSLQRLLESENIAFLAVFLNYLLSNSEPSPLLFYLITGLYKEGTAKDMRKWVYEIHSTFLVPRAPLVWYRHDESLAREIDAVLQNEFDKVEILRKIFWKSRKKARDIICEQLREFQHKRTAGLGTIYGPTDAQLLDAKGDKQREQNIFEETLMRKLQILIEEYEKDSPLEDAKKLALCSALSTVIHRIFIPRSHPNNLLDRVHHFVSREKSFKSRIMGKKNKVMVRGHSLVLRQYYEVTHCNHCQTIIWGVSPQGFHCTDCKLNIHRQCSKVLEENCPGPLPPSKRKDTTQNDNKITKLMGKIRPRTSNEGMDKRSRQESEDFEAIDSQNERNQHAISMQRQSSDRKSDDLNPLLRCNGNTSMNLSNNDIQNCFLADISSIGLNSNTASSAGYNNMAQEVIMNSALLPTNQHSASSGMGVVGLDINSALATAGLAAVAGGVANDMTASSDISDSANIHRDRLNAQHHKGMPALVNRSESYKERLSHKRNRSHRKTSDPSLISRSNDEPSYAAAASTTNLIASSNSSLSSSIGSESYTTNSMEQMGGSGIATTTGPTTTNNFTNHQHLHHYPSVHADSFHAGNANNVSVCSGAVNMQYKSYNFDSDEDDDLNEVDWSSNVPADILSTLTDAEKKRQEIINEIYQTERSHVRTLKLLDRLFFNPLQESGLLSQEYLLLLFPPSLVSLCDLHGAFEQKLKTRRFDDSYIVNRVGDLLIGMFDGVCGDELREYAAQFCARQKIALETLKEKRRKDEQLQKLLSKAESHKACRRLQLKDLLPTVLQRLTKYPLLFENLYKITVNVMPENESEAEAIQRAWELSKTILVDVNQAVKTAEDAHKLQTIQRKLDKSTFDKEEFRNLDLTQYRLVHDGSLTMKKNPSIQLHGLLFESMIVLLTKQDDKYCLKYLHAARNTEVNNKPVNPIMSIDSETLVRQEAADKNSFFLIKTKTSQMLELRAPSSTECKTWFKHISDATEQYKLRSKNTNHETTDDNATTTFSSHSTAHRESMDLSVERQHMQTIAANHSVPLVPLAPVVPTITTPTPDKLSVDGPFKYHQSLQNNTSNEIPHGSNGVTKNGTMSTIATHSETSHPYYNLLPVSNSNDRTLSPSSTTVVNRTMSTRSCGDAATTAASEFSLGNGVTLRHTKSARQANEGTAASADTKHSLALNDSSIEDNSIVYSHNPNNTRTLLHSAVPLIDPSEVKVQINKSYSAMPVLTTGEKLKRLDANIRDSLREKQKIICDMFSLPMEHFHEIVDIAAMPEAPKDSVDIALAAYAQVQQLTKIINEYMQATSVEELFNTKSSPALCDKCMQKDLINRVESPPPLPPPKKHRTNTLTQQQQISTCGVMKRQVPPTPATPTPTAIPQIEMSAIHENDDGYCEIDELRLPAVPHSSKLSPIETPANSLSSALQSKDNLKSSSSDIITSNLCIGKMKEPATICCVDSIPEESAEEVCEALQSEHHQHNSSSKTNVKQNSQLVINNKAVNLHRDIHAIAEEDFERNEECLQSNIPTTESGKEVLRPLTPHSTIQTHKLEKFENTASSEISKQNNDSSEEQSKEERIAEDGVDDSLKTKCIKNKSRTGITMVDSCTQTLAPIQSLASTVLRSNHNHHYTPCTNTNTINTTSNSTITIDNHKSTDTAACGTNCSDYGGRMEPSIPCHFLSSIIANLNAQITLLLPKINERDLERERLRHENQHLRDLLSAMHECQRVEQQLKTPNDDHVKKNAKETNDDDDSEVISNPDCSKSENGLVEQSVEAIVDLNANIPNEKNAFQTSEILEVPINVANNNELTEDTLSSSDSKLEESKVTDNIQESKEVNESKE